ncbi:hypothetical protein CaCOL14_012240 [Colletotrichum acutatum]
MRVTGCRTTVVLGDRVMETSEPKMTTNAVKRGPSNLTGEHNAFDPLPSSKCLT